MIWSYPWTAAEYITWCACTVRMMIPTDELEGYPKHASVRRYVIAAALLALIGGALYGIVRPTSEGTDEAPEFDLELLDFRETRDSLKRETYFFGGQHYSEADAVRALARLASGKAGPETDRMISSVLPAVEDCHDCADFILVPLLWCRGRRSAGG